MIGCWRNSCRFSLATVATCFAKFCFFVFPLCAFFLMGAATPEKLHTLYNSLDPLSVSQHLAFYSLYQDTEQGNQALAHCLQLLTKETGTRPLSPNIPSFPEGMQAEGIQAMIALITKPEGDTLPLINETQWECIETLAKHLPHRRLQGHWVETEEEVIALPAQEIDLSHGWMLSQFPGTDPENLQQRRSYESLLDLMALQILARTPLTAHPREKIQAINRFLFDEMQFRFPPQSQFAKEIDEYTFLSSVLDLRRGVCLGVSILYVCLAQRLGLQLEMVTPPGHIYVRYREGEELINIETTARGIHLDDEVYLSVDTCALETKNTKEMIGLAHFNQAGVFLQKADPEKALASYLRAQPYLPDNPPLKEFMAYQLLLLGKTEEGIAQLKEIVGKESPFAVSQENMAEDVLNGAVDTQGIAPIFQSVDQKRSSVLEKKEKLENVLQKYPNFRAAMFQLGICWLQLHRDKEAYETFQKYHQLDPKSASVEYYLAILAWKRQEVKKAWQFLAQACALTEKRSHHPRALRNLKREFAMMYPQTRQPVRG